MGYRKIHIKIYHVQRIIGLILFNWRTTLNWTNWWSVLRSTRTSSLRRRLCQTDESCIFGG